MADPFTNRFKAAQEAARAARLAKAGGAASSGPVTGSALTAKMQAVRDRMATVNAVKPTVYAPDPPKPSSSISAARAATAPQVGGWYVNGVRQAGPYSPEALNALMTSSSSGSSNNGKGMGNYGTGISSGSSSGGGIGGYTGLRDMVDGGGPGRSGSTFSGGGLVSGALNAAGVSPVGSSKSSGKSTSSTKK